MHCNLKHASEDCNTTGVRHDRALLGARKGSSSPRRHDDTEPSVLGHPLHFGRGQLDVYLFRVVVSKRSLRRGTAPQTRCGSAEQPSVRRVNTSSLSKQPINVVAQNDENRRKRAPHSMSCTAAYCGMSKCPPIVAAQSSYAQ